ncbi:unnamed protein product [Rhizophagus irregularis]|nr:unnamed protein product [Rhizophagus irregularis]
MTMATLWNDHKLTTFLTSCDASTFKETCRLFRELGGHTQGLRYSASFSYVRQEVAMKSGNTGQNSNSNQLTKKDKKSSTKHAKDDNQLKNPNSQKKAQRVGT